jgi:Family of unknown function (DUF6508)
VSPDLRQLLALARYEAIFEAPGFVFAAWHEPIAGPDGVVELGWAELTAPAEQFLAEMYERGLVYDFDWMAWAGTPVGRRLLSTSQAVASESGAQLAKVLTALVRNDRFSEGQLASAFASGTLTAIASRAGVLARSMAAPRR